MKRLVDSEFKAPPSLRGPIVEPANSEWRAAHYSTQGRAGAASGRPRPLLTAHWLPCELTL